MTAPTGVRLARAHPRLCHREPDARTNLQIPSVLMDMGSRGSSLGRSRCGSGGGGGGGGGASCSLVVLEGGNVPLILHHDGDRCADRDVPSALGNKELGNEPLVHHLERCRYWGNMEGVFHGGQGESIT